ncbi:MAG: conjugal transfer protein TraF [Betaproteobacteria bacterium]|nr:conjugal transfer protein TraF [Betaproteobacteria bacterium]
MPRALLRNSLTQRLAITAGLALGLSMVCGAQAARTAQTLADDIPAVDPMPLSDAPDVAMTYWRQHREGWFWYRDPLPPKPRPPSTTPKKPKDLADFESLQQRLEELKRVAVMNPTDTNLLAYMRFQRMVMDKSQVFADRWQRLVWSAPDLDYGMSGRPTNAMAINVFDDQQRDRDGQTVRSLAATHGLIFVFRSDCPFCHRFAPILKRFEQDYGMTVLAISLDGGTLPDYPDARPDNGMAARLNATAVPALYLTAPARREIRPVGFGLMSMSDLLERVAALARDRTDAATNPGRTLR